MKIQVILILSLSFTLNVLGQTLPDSGFTNKEEAKNLLVNRLKEGKWCEYAKGNGAIIHHSIILSEIQQNKFVPSPAGGPNEPDFYNLTFYKDGVPIGIVRKYNLEGELMEETPYRDGIGNGLHKTYYKGKLFAEVRDSAGRANGVAKRYYFSGKLMSEEINRNGLKNGVAKEYYQNGKLKSEITYKDDEVIVAKKYDENGNEIK